MNTQLHLARGIVHGRTHTDQDPVLLRTLELARKQSRQDRRGRRRLRVVCSRIASRTAPKTSF